MPGHDEFSVAYAAATERARSVMAGFIPAIHVLGSAAKKDVDARDKPGHDG